MATNENFIFQFKRGTAQRWAEVNPILLNGEPGYEYDTGKLKIGDGATPWLALNYQNANSYSISPDGNSLIYDKDGKLCVYGFVDAEANTVPMKDKNGQLKWVALDIGDLVQTKTFILYGGSATDVMEEESNEPTTI